MNQRDKEILDLAIQHEFGGAAGGDEPREHLFRDDDLLRFAKALLASESGRVVAYRVSPKGRVIKRSDPWENGKPLDEYVEYVNQHDEWAIEYAYAATQPADPVRVPGDESIVGLQNAFDRGKWFGARYGHQPTSLESAARAVLAVPELASIACTGSDAPAEHALGLLVDAMRGQPAVSARPSTPSVTPEEDEAWKQLEAKQQETVEVVNSLQPVPRLYQHVDGRYGLSFGPAQFAINTPEWYSVPIDIIEDAQRGAARKEHL